MLQRLNFKHCLFWVAVITLTQNTFVYGQVLSGDANGKSTILFEGGNLGFNLQEQAFDVAYNHFQNYRFRRGMDSTSIAKLVANKNFVMPAMKRLVFGINARGKAANGLATIFGGGNLASQGRIGVYLGRSKLGDYAKETKVAISKIEKERNRNALFAQGLKERYVRLLEEKGLNWILDLKPVDNVAKFKTAPEIETYRNRRQEQMAQFQIDSVRLKVILDAVLTRNMPTDFSLQFQNIQRLAPLAKIAPWADLAHLIPQAYLTSLAPLAYFAYLNDSLIVEFSEFMAFEAEKAYQTDYVKNISPLEDKFNKAVDSLGKMRNYWTKRNTYYINAGFEGIGFKLMGEFDSTDASKSYSDKSFSGFYANLGYNWHYGEENFGFLGPNSIIGINGGFANTSNFGGLQSRALTVRKVSVDKSKQELISEKKVDVYSGFETYWQFSFNLDLVKIYKIEEKYTVATTYYLRHNAPLTKGIKTVTTTDLGVSSYFFKDGGVFMGGLYIQFPDVYDNNRINRDNQESQSISQRWTFGIVSKINFVTLFGY